MTWLWMATICANLLCGTLIALRQRYGTILCCQLASAMISVMTYQLYHDDACLRRDYETWWYLTGGLSWLLEGAVLWQFARHRYTVVIGTAAGTIITHLSVKLAGYISLIPYTAPVTPDEVYLFRLADYLNLAVMLCFVLVEYADGGATAPRRTP